MEWSRWSKAKRAVRSVPDVFIAVFITSLVTVVAAFISAGRAVHDLIPWMGFGFVLSLCVIVVQAYVKYVNDKYDPTLALRYERIFDEEMKSDRSIAARLLKDENHHLCEIGNQELEEKAGRHRPRLGPPGHARVLHEGRSNQRRRHASTLLLLDPWVLAGCPTLH